MTVNTFWMLFAVTVCFEKQEFIKGIILVTMLIALSKLLPIFLYPVGLIFLLLLACVLLRNNQRFLRILLLAVLLILVVAGNRWVSLGLVRSLEMRFSPPTTIDQVDAIVLLGGGTEILAPPRPLPEVNGAGDRITYAVKLYREGRSAYILASGGRIPWYGPASSTPAEEMLALLEFMGVPSEAVILESKSQNTAENAEFSAVLLQKYNANSVLLVTSAMHMPRAVAYFETLGVEIFPAPTDFIVSEAEWQGLVESGPVALFLSFFPTSGSLNQTTNALKEYLGLLVFHLQHGF